MIEWSSPNSHRDVKFEEKYFPWHHTRETWMYYVFYKGYMLDIFLFSAWLWIAMNDNCHFAIAIYKHDYNTSSQLHFQCQHGEFPRVCPCLVKRHFHVLFLSLQLSTQLWDLEDNFIITGFFALKQLKTTCRTSQTVKYAHTG